MTWKSLNWGGWAVAVLVVGCGGDSGGDESGGSTGGSGGETSGSEDGAGGDAGSTGGKANGDPSSGGAASGGAGTGGFVAIGGTGGTILCPPCVPPPSTDCVGTGACGCGPYICPSTGGGSGQDCGDTVCTGNTVCCNAAQSLCAPPDVFCTQ